MRIDVGKVQAELRWLVQTPIDDMAIADQHEARSYVAGQKAALLKILDGVFNESEKLPGTTPEERPAAKSKASAGRTGKGRGVGVRANGRKARG